MRKSERILAVNEYYNANELLLMKLKPMSNLGLDFWIYEKESRYYFFRKHEGNLLRLYCSTARPYYNL